MIGPGGEGKTLFVQSVASKITDKEGPLRITLTDLLRGEAPRGKKKSSTTISLGFNSANDMREIILSKLRENTPLVYIDDAAEKDISNKYLSDETIIKELNNLINMLDTICPIYLTTNTNIKDISPTLLRRFGQNIFEFTHLEGQDAMNAFMQYHEDNKGSNYIKEMVGNDEKMKKVANFSSTGEEFLKELFTRDYTQDANNNFGKLDHPVKFSRDDIPNIYESLIMSIIHGDQFYKNKKPNSDIINRIMQPIIRRSQSEHEEEMLNKVIFSWLI